MKYTPLGFIAIGGNVITGADTSAGTVANASAKKKILVRKPFKSRSYANTFTTGCAIALVLVEVNVHGADSDASLVRVVVGFNCPGTLRPYSNRR